MGMGEGRGRSRSWFFTEKSVERGGRFWGRFIWGRISLSWSSVNCGGGDCSPGSGWLAGPMVCRRPPCATLVLGSRPGPGSPASVYTSVGESEGSAIPQLATPASHLFCATLASAAAVIWSLNRAARFIATSLLAVAASVPGSAAAAMS